MGITSDDLASSGNGLINPFSTASVLVENSVENLVENLVEKEAGSDPIENLLPALLQIFLTVGLSIFFYFFKLFLEATVAVPNFHFSTCAILLGGAWLGRWGLHCL